MILKKTMNIYRWDAASLKYRSKRHALFLAGMILLITPSGLLVHAEDAFRIASMTLHDEALAGAHDVELQGDLAFVPGKRNSLSIVDISNPERPKLLWSLSSPEIPDSETVLPMGDFLLLGTRDFLTLDIRDPSNPIILKKISDRPRIDKINGMILLGNYVLGANKSGYITAFDITDIRNPALFGALETNEQFGLRLPHDIADYGDHIVIVDPNGFTPPVGRLGIFKVLENGRMLPVVEWSLTGKIEASELVGANRVQIKKNYAYVGGSLTPEARALSSEPSRVSVVDISDPSRPTIVASLPFDDVRGPNGLTIAGNVLFCAGGQTISAYDISDPENPIQIASQSFPVYRYSERTDNYHDLVYRDGYLYISAQSDNGFLILKIEDRSVRTLADAL